MSVGEHDVMVDDLPEERRGPMASPRRNLGSSLPAAGRLWCKILTDVHQNDVFAFASSCRQLGAQVSCGRTLKTKTKQYLQGRGREVSVGFEWHSRCTRVKTKEDMKARTMLINASAFLGHLEVRQNRTESITSITTVAAPLRILILTLFIDSSLRRCFVTGAAGLWRGWGCGTRGPVTRQGSQSLKWLREVKCPWDSSTCEEAAGGAPRPAKVGKGRLRWADEAVPQGGAVGRLDVLKWARREGALDIRSVLTQRRRHRDFGVAGGHSRG